MSPLADVPQAHLPTPPSERGAWLTAATIAAIGLALLVAALSGRLAGATTTAPPPVVLRAPGPTAGPLAAASALAAVAGRTAGSGTPAGTGAGGRALAANTTAAGTLAAPTVQIAERWMEGFYPIYATAQRTFGVNWLLLASIHMQETAFSTARGTYAGLNFARCCGGPMQFNVTNGRVTTWALVADSYRFAPRPARYDHATASHPSIYDDFDAIMAAAHLLSAAGAGYALDASAWAAAYDYYGHDAGGVAYADAVLARAIGWSQHGFCVNCGIDAGLVGAVHAAYGAPVSANLASRTPARGRGAGLARVARLPASAP